MGMSRIADGLDAARETRGIGRPRSDAVPPFGAGVPSRIHPPVVEVRPMRREQSNSIGLGLFALMQSEACGIHMDGELSIRMRNIFLEHPSAPNILCPDRVALVEH